MKPIDDDVRKLLESKTLKVIRRVKITYEFYDGDSLVGDPMVMFNGFLDETTEDGPTMHIKATAVAVPLEPNEAPAQSRCE